MSRCWYFEYGALYLVNHKNAVGTILNILLPSDAVLLCADAVLHWQQDWPEQIPVYLLAEDVQARNVQPPVGMQSIEYSKFVALCTDYAKVIAW